MERQFKGIKYIHSLPYFMLYDLEKDIMEIIPCTGDIKILKHNRKLCNGYYDLEYKKYKPCDDKIDMTDLKINQCEECKKKSGFYNCLKCNGSTCFAVSHKTLNFCNQSHIVYIALFGNNKVKVGTAAEYRGYTRLEEQGAIAAFIVSIVPNGRLARSLELFLSKKGFALTVQSNYKIKNIIINDNNLNVEDKLYSIYQKIIREIPSSYENYIIPFKSIYNKKINDINKIVFPESKSQLSLFNEMQELTEVNYEYELNPSDIEGKIINTIGTIIVINKNENHIIIETKKLEGYIVDIDNKII